VNRSALVLVLLAGIPLAAHAASGPTSFTNPTGIAVPGAGAATPYPSAITVSGLAGQVVKVTVTLIGLSHTRPADLDVLLVGPRGQAVLLLSDCCATPANGQVTVTFDDFGSRVSADGALLSGTAKPVNVDSASDHFPPPAPAGPYVTRLSVFNGTDPNGVWRLFVHDDEAGHEGRIAGGWSLTIQTQTRADGGPPVPDPRLAATPPAEPPGAASELRRESLSQAYTRIDMAVTFGVVPGRGPSSASAVPTNWSESDDDRRCGAK
jgi:subtilisin-like proprotein convertase family protein